MNERRPHFMSVYNPELSYEMLNIPFKLLKHLEGVSSGSASLAGPTGRTWCVDLIRHDNALFFSRGWPEFVRAHYLDSGDSLVFRYEGFLSFTVFIFDASGCEKDTEAITRIIQEANMLDECVMEEKCFQQSGPFFKNIKVPKRKRGSIGPVLSEDAHCNGADLDASVPGLTEVLPLRQEPAAYAKRLRRASPFTASRPHRKKSAASVNKRVASGSGSPSFNAKCSTARVLSLQAERRAAQDFFSSFPIFVRIMKNFNVGGSYTLKIPYQFATEYLPSCRVKLILHNLQGDSWIVNSVPTTKVHTFHTLCGGWMAFVRGNDIKLGDTCIFELIKKCEMRVHVIGSCSESLHNQNKAASLPSLQRQKLFSGTPDNLPGSPPQSESEGCGVKKESEWAIVVHDPVEEYERS